MNLQPIVIILGTVWAACAADGVAYTRWGRTNCGSGSELVYAGVAGGSFYSQTGGGSNYLCLTMRPTWYKYDDRQGGVSAYVHGAEYQTGSAYTQMGNPWWGLHDHDVPCAACYARDRSATIMIPGTVHCTAGWTKEYDGYIMADYHKHPSRTEFVCMDRSPEADRGDHHNHNGALFYFTETKCGSLPCPPYVDNRELSCVVCTK